MKIFLGADHNGFHMRHMLAEFLREKGYELEDEGDTKLDPADDYPVFAAKVVHQLLSSDDKEAKGILLCGSGQGMCMAANRFKGIRACLGYDRQSVVASRTDDDANVLCLPADFLTKSQTQLLAETFLTTKFAAAPRFSRRIREIDELS